jgi:hypothetical protein
MLNARRTHRWMWGVLLVGMAMTRAAHADGDPTAIAESLFRQGKAALDRGSVGEACILLAKSQALEKSDGTLLLLAICHEKEGRTATAWSEYRQVEAHGRTDRAKYARQRATAIEPQLAYVELHLTTGESVSPLRLRLDRDTTIDPSVLGTQIPIDPGPHEITLECQGRESSKKTFSAVPQTTASVDLTPGPLLAKPPAPPPSPRLPPKPAPPSNKTTTIVAGVGIGLAAVGIGLGTGFGLRALSLSGEAKDLCGGVVGTCTDPKALELRSDANLPATISTVAFVTAGVALVVTVVTLVVSPGQSPKAVPAMAPGGFRF